MADDEETVVHFASRLSKTKRPLIQVSSDSYTDLAEETERALLLSGLPLYRRGNRLVSPATREVDGPDGVRTHATMLLEVPCDYLREFMDRAARFESLSRNKWVAVSPPKFIADLILARPAQWLFREVAGIVTAPTLDAKGRLITEPGYDPATRLFLTELPVMPHVPLEPGWDDALRALADLDALLGEFNFVDQASRSVALSAMLTLVCRGGIPLAPMHAASAPTPGSGKSYLFDVAAAIATGRPCPVITAGRREEETEKRLGAVMMAGQSVISLDNVVGNLSSSLLCQALERPLVLVRILGLSQVAEIEVRTTWFATGTNLKIIDDLTRRTVVTRIDADMERPEQRNFRNDPVATVMRERGRYIAACLTIVRAYIVAGMPGKLVPLASYPAWSNLVRSSLVWLGRADPCDTIADMRADDPSLQLRRAVYAAWPARDVYYTTADLIELADQDSDFGKTDDGRTLHEALHTVAPGAKKDKGIDNLTLGKWLGANKDRVVDGCKLVREDGPRGRPRWKIETKRRAGSSKNAL
jgi:putative DNA primase/helicase